MVACLLSYMQGHVTLETYKGMGVKRVVNFNPELREQEIWPIFQKYQRLRHQHMRWVTTTTHMQGRHTFLWLRRQTQCIHISPADMAVPLVLSECMIPDLMASHCLAGMT